MKPLDDVITCLQEIRDRYPELNSDTFAHGRLELTIKDGVLVTIGPLPCFRRGKEFCGLHVPRLDISEE